jgi:hypothetical protein
MQRFTADGTILEIFGEFLVALFVHDMRTVGWFDDFFALEAGCEGFAANRAGGSCKVGVSIGRWGSCHIDHIVAITVRRSRSSEW